MADTVRARVFLHTAPDMTPEPTVDEVRDWLRRDRAGWHLAADWQVADVLEARAALMDAKRGPRVQCTAVFLPDDGNWHTGQLVEIRAIDQETESTEVKVTYLTPDDVAAANDAIDAADRITPVRIPTEDQEPSDD